MTTAIQQAIEASRERETREWSIATEDAIVEDERRFREALAVAIKQILFQKCYCDKQQKYQFSFSPCSRCRSIASIEAIVRGE